MKYVPPVGGAVNDPYVDANPGSGIEGSPVPAAAIEHPMRELIALVVDAGLVPTEATLTQVAAAVRTLMQKNLATISAAGGTADAITGVYTPALAALTNGMTLYVRAGSANATTTPTFTPASGTIAAKTIVKGNGVAVVAGDIAGAGHWIELKYDLTLDKWLLLNPAFGVMSNRSQLFSASGSFTVPANVTTIYLTGCGGGGGGAAYNSGVTGGGGGGAGASAYRQSVVVTPGSVVTVTIGSNGSGGAVAGAAGSAGGTTSFGALLSLGGGAGGASASAGGGGGSASGGSGGLVCSGQTGEQYNPINSTTAMGGRGGGSMFGGGGLAGGMGTSNAVGGAAQGFGSGGGGGAQANGGAGKPGMLIVEW